MLPTSGEKCGLSAAAASPLSRKPAKAAYSQTSRAPALPCRSSESETIRNRPIPLRSWYPVAVHLNALVALRRSSCPFVDSSFSFVFFRLFQASEAPAPHDGADHPSGKQIVFQEKCLQVSWFQLVPRSEAAWAPGLFQASRAPAPHAGADHSEEKQPALFVVEMKTNHE